jgi:hypothetical protein
MMQVGFDLQGVLSNCMIINNFLTIFQIRDYYFILCHFLKCNIFR